MPNKALLFVVNIFPKYSLECLLYLTCSTITDPIANPFKDTGACSSKAALVNVILHPKKGLTTKDTNIAQTCFSLECIYREAWNSKHENILWHACSFEFIGNKINYVQKPSAERMRSNCPFLFMHKSVWKRPKAILPYM